MLVDTHAHLQFPDYEGKVGDYLARASAVGVEQVITIGVDAADSAKGIELAQQFDQVYATVGLHPHDAKAGIAELPQIKTLANQPRVVAIGECGLDYYRNLSPATEQEQMLRAQLELAGELGYPVVFHVREAYADFWRIYQDYRLPGVVHSFSGSGHDLEQALKHDLLVALNGIATFTKDAPQVAVFKAVPLGSLVLETDCPFLTPQPRRGQVNEPAEVKTIADFLCRLRGESFEQLAAVTTANARRLFGI
jgi:TatD DNase family protein